MKRFLLYSVGGTAIFMAGAATATVIVGRMVLPVVDTDKVVDKVMLGMDRTKAMIERKVFGEPRPKVDYQRYNTVRLSRVPEGEDV